MPAGRGARSALINRDWSRTKPGSGAASAAMPSWRLRVSPENRQGRATACETPCAPRRGICQPTASWCRAGSAADSRRKTPGLRARTGPRPARRDARRQIGSGDRVPLQAVIAVLGRRAQPCSSGCAGAQRESASRPIPTCRVIPTPKRNGSPSPAAPKRGRRRRVNEPATGFRRRGSAENGRPGRNRPGRQRVSAGRSGRAP
jgi:hypothetical protein